MFILICFIAGIEDDLSTQPSAKRSTLVGRTSPGNKDSCDIFWIVFLIIWIVIFQNDGNVRKETGSVALER